MLFNTGGCSLVSIFSLNLVLSISTGAGVLISTVSFSNSFFQAKFLFTIADSYFRATCVCSPEGL